MRPGTENRVDHLRSLLASADLDAVIITNGTNRRYLTGFTGADHAPDEPAGIVLVSDTLAILFTAGTNLPWAAAEIGDEIEARQWERPWPESVARLAAEHHWVKIGFEERTTTAADYFALCDRLGDDISLVAIGALADSLRDRKDASELAALRAALAMTDAAYVAAEAQIRPGQTEREIADIVRHELRAVGSEGEAFPTIVASGPNAAKPHHAPSDRQVQEGEPIIIDMGAAANGYSGDLTRTTWLGHPPERLVTIYEAVAAAHQMAIPLYRAGTPGRAVDLQVREFFAERGMNDFFIHGLGHGLGLRVHESPSVGPASTDILAPGQIVTVEPGLYIAGWGGVRIENVVAITEGAPENLTGAPIRVIQHEKEQAQ